MVRASYGLVQATVGVGTVLIVYFGVAYTRGGGVMGKSGFHLGGGVDRAPQTGVGGGQEKGSIDRTINQSL